VEVSELLSSTGKANSTSKNLRQVNDCFIVGTAELWKFCQAFRAKHKDSHNLRWQPGRCRERRRVEELGMQLSTLSLNYWTLPQQKSVDEFLELLDDEQLRPILCIVCTEKIAPEL